MTDMQRTGLNLLEVVRLSRLTGAAVWQHEENQAYASRHGDPIVATAEDLDVSGSVFPFYRSGLGPWLTDERAAGYDSLIVTDLDRLSRTHLRELQDWLHNRGKVIVCTDPGAVQAGA